MKKHLVSFATQNCKNSQNILENSALQYGFDIIHTYNEKDIDLSFIEKHNDIFCNFQSRGAGFWLWKPWIILDVMKKINDNDIVAYFDVGCSLINNVKPLIDLTIINDILLFKIHNQKINMWCKGDSLEIIGYKEKWLNEELSNGAFQFYKKTNKSIIFLNEYLKYCTDKRVINDDCNVLSNKNPYGFIEHRHDQSILSILTKKYNIKQFRDPSQWGNNFIEKDILNYEQIINHHRNKN